MIYKEVERQVGKQQPGRLGNEMDAAPLAAAGDSAPTCRDGTHLQGYWR